MTNRSQMPELDWGAFLPPPPYKIGCQNTPYKLGLNEVIPHCTRSINCRLCLQRFNEYHAYEYAQMNKSINKVLEYP